MALNLTGVRRFVPAADGNRDLPEDLRISLEILPLRVRDMLEVQRLIRDLGADFAAAIGSDADPVKTERLWSAMEGIITKHTRDWRGVTIDGRAAVEPAEVLSACGLDQVELMSEVAREIIDSGRGTAGEAKNSASPPGPSDSGSGMTALPASPPEDSGSATAAADSSP